MDIDNVAWRSEIRNVVGVSLGEVSSLCILRAYAERETPNTPAKHYYEVKHLQHYSGMTFPQVIEDVHLILQRLKQDCDLVLDETQVGREVSDLFKAIARPIRVNIPTSGNETVQTGAACYTVPLSLLLSAIDARLHCGELRLAREIMGSVDLESSLKDLRDRQTVPDIHADTLASALAIAVWRATTKKAKFGRSRPQVNLGYAEMKRIYRRPSKF
ncbi:MAG TPA: hypothetical protein VIZ87_06015 [Terrimicrobium sp.]